MTNLRKRLRFPRWLSTRFGTTRLEDESAEREEYGLPDRGRAELERDRFSPVYEGGEAVSAALDELDAFKVPSGR